MRAPVVLALLLGVSLPARAGEDAPLWERIYGYVVVGRAQEVGPLLTTKGLEEIATDARSACTLLLASAHAVAANVAADAAQMDPLLPFLQALAERVRGLHGADAWGTLAPALAKVVRLRYRAETIVQVDDAEWTAVAEAVGTGARTAASAPVAGLLAADLLTELAWYSAAIRATALAQADRLLAEFKNAQEEPLGVMLVRCQALRRARVELQARSPGWALTVAHGLEAAEPAVQPSATTRTDMALVELLNRTITDLRLAGGTTEVEYREQGHTSRGALSYALPFYTRWRQDFGSSWPATLLADQRRERPEGTSSVKVWYSGAGPLKDSKTELRALARTLGERAVDELYPVGKKHATPSINAKARALNAKIPNAFTADVRVKVDGQPILVTVWTWRGSVQENNFAAIITIRGEALANDPEVAFFLSTLMDVR